MKNTSNLLDLDYAAEAKKFSTEFPRIIDFHSHIVGGEASKIYKRAARDYGISKTFSMTPLRQVPAVQQVMGDSIHFIAIHDWTDPNPHVAIRDGYIETIERFYEFGSRVVKFWSAPRGIDTGHKYSLPDLMKIDAPHRLLAMKRAAELKMIMMVHVGDPDTWFATKYSDSSRYGTKRDQYIGFERVLDMFDRPWIGAHMGGWPEDLNFLSGMFERHPNLYLDCSATKWMVRELSKHPRDELIDFFSHWKGRILFGSDIVTNDAHLSSEQTGNEMGDKAKSAEEAYDLYASRYWAFRTLLEKDYEGQSPIADPDLAMVDPQRYTPQDAPHLSGKRLPTEILQTLYYEAAEALFRDAGLGSI